MLIHDVKQENLLVDVGPYTLSRAKPSNPSGHLFPSDFASLPSGYEPGMGMSSIPGESTTEKEGLWIIYVDSTPRQPQRRVEICSRGFTYDGGVHDMGIP